MTPTSYNSDEQGDQSDKKSLDQHAVLWYWGDAMDMGVCSPLGAKVNNKQGESYVTLQSLPLRNGANSAQENRKAQEEGKFQ